MMDKNNSGFSFQSTGSKLEFSHNDSIESIISSKNRNCTIQNIFVSAMDMINHILIVLVTLYLVYHSAKEYSVTNVHVILCTIGVSILCLWNTHSISLFFFFIKNIVTHTLVLFFVTVMDCKSFRFQSWNVYLFYLKKYILVLP